MRNYTAEEIVELKVNPKITMEVKLSLTLKDKKWEYKIYEKEDDKFIEVFNRISPKPPTEQSQNANMFTKPHKIIYGTPETKDENTSLVSSTFIKLENIVLEKIENTKQAIVNKKENEYRELQIIGEQFYNKFKQENRNVISYIASVCRLISAKEEGNIIKVLLAMISTAKGEPMNIISESASGTGKSHVEKCACELISDKHWMILNGSTAAGFKNLALEDPYIFQNKTVRFGDLGEEVAQEVMAEVLSIVKILNSEGYYKSQKTAPDGLSVMPIELYGGTALCYSKVANNKEVSDQDTSRGITYTPNIRNHEDFKEFELATSVLTDEELKEIEYHKRQIRGYVEFIINYDDINVFNPYLPFLQKLFENNKLYRRIGKKQDYLVRNLALLNLPNKDIYEINGEKWIFVTVEDMINYFSLMYEDNLTLASFDMDIHSLNLLELLLDEYEVIQEHEIKDHFFELLESHGTDMYEDKIIEESNKFFTVKILLDKYYATTELNNIVSEVKRKEDKLRDTLKKMREYIGYWRIPDKYAPDRFTPVLFYIKNNISYINKLELDAGYINLAKQRYGTMIDDVIEDFKVSIGLKKIKAKKSRKKLVYVGDISDFELEIEQDYEVMTLPSLDYSEPLIPELSILDEYNSFEDSEFYEF